MFQAFYKQIIEEYIQAYNEMDVENMMLNMDQTIEYEQQINRRIQLKLTGFREFKDHAELSKQLVTSRKQTAKNFEFEGNAVFVEIEFEGILAKDLDLHHKKSNHFQTTSTSEFVFFQNKIIQIIEKLKG